MRRALVVGWSAFPWSDAGEAWLPDFVATDRRGARLRTAGGASWMDLRSGIWNATHGHAVPAVRRAVAEAAARQPGLGQVLRHRSAAAERLGSALLRAWGEPEGWASFGVSGTQAIDRGARLLLSLLEAEVGSAALAGVEGAYHGESGLARRASAREHFAALPAGEDRIPRLTLPAASCSRCDLGRGCDGACLTVLERALARRRGGVVLVLEPVQITNGFLQRSAAWYRRLARIRRAARGRLLILADEVACGMGRVGTTFAQARVGVTADATVLGKALTGGIVPLSVVLMSARIGSRLRHAGLHEAAFGGTYDGYPIGVAAATAQLRAMRGSIVRRRAAAVEAALQEALGALRGEAVDVRVCGAAASLRVRGRLLDDVVGAVDRARRLIYVERDVALFLPPLSASPREVVHEVTQLARAVLRR